METLKAILGVFLIFAMAWVLHDHSLLEQKIEAELESKEIGAPTWSVRSELPEEWKEAVHATEVVEEEHAVPAFLPEMRVVASVSEPEGEDGRKRVIESLETSRREKFVRVERTMQAYSDGGSRVVDEVAMVANQLRVKRPVGMATYMFLDLLGRAGATEVTELDEGAYLATFQARPEDPLALDAFSAKVQELADVEIPMEPNYLHRGL